MTAIETNELEIREMLLDIVRAMVDRPNDVEIALISSHEGFVFVVRAHQTDVGKLIGRNGQTVRALQIIASAAGLKPGLRFKIDVVQESDTLRS
jgi:predicted RNA-binding protein YlqC (UPF0109 family)